MCYCLEARILYESSLPDATGKSGFFHCAIRNSRLEIRKEMARPARFERTTFGFGGQRSIQLSYGRGKGKKRERRPEGRLSFYNLG